MTDQVALLAALLEGHECEAGGWHCSCQPVDAEERRPVLPVTWEVHLAGAIIDDGWQRPPAPREAKTIPARATDPGTSHAATRAAKLTAGSQRARLLAAFADQAATFGLTDEEAADLADGVPYRSEFAKRCSELREAGWIEPTGTTRKGVSGLDRIVSRITDAGRTALEAVPDD